MYTTQGLMSMADYQDWQVLTDHGPHPRCPGHEETDYQGALVFVRCSVNEECPDEQQDDHELTVNPFCPGHDAVDANQCDVTVRCSADEECPEELV